MEPLEAHRAAMARFDHAVRSVRTDQLDDETPCAEWTVHDLVNHLVAEQWWAPHLLAGETVGQVGDRYDGDQLGRDPLHAWQRASSAARQAWARDGVLDRTVHLSFGDAPATDYCWQMTLDLAVHAWDLAVAIGADADLDEELALALIEEFAPQVPRWVASGMFAAPVEVPAGADAGTRLVALMGREP